METTSVKENFYIEMPIDGELGETVFVSGTMTVPVTVRFKCPAGTTWFFEENMYDIRYGYTVQNSLYNITPDYGKINDYDINFRYGNARIVSNDKIINIQENSGQIFADSNFKRSYYIDVVYDVYIDYAIEYIMPTSYSYTAEVNLDINSYFTWTQFEAYRFIDNYYTRIETKIDALSEDGAGIQGAINNQTDVIEDLQNIANDLQEESNETQKGILGQITDFFGSFFENIINSVKSLFIPEDGYFSDFFARLNNFFSEKLGVLYAPIDIFVDILTGISNASGTDAGIPFPGVSWEGVWIIEPQTISLSTYSNVFPDLQQKIYFVTDLIMVGSVLWLLQNKLKEVMTN